MLVDDDAPNYNSSTQIKKSELTQNINNFYENMLKYMKYYLSNLTYQNTLYNQLNNTNINFAWTDYLAHNYFSHYEVEIGGQVFEYYSSDQSFIYQYHHLNEEYKKNYYKMVGHDMELNKYNNKPKTSQTLILPLNFWFCKDIGSSLPAVAMINSSVNINLKINKLKNLLYFQDYEQDYYNFLNIIITYDPTIHANLNIKTFIYDPTSELATYVCLNINYQLFVIQYPSLSSDNINNILDIYGTNGVMVLNDWIQFKQNYKENQDIVNPDRYNDYNALLSTIPKPQIKLVCQSIFLDDTERTKFASTKLEYVIEIFQENDYNINPKQSLINEELSIVGPVKELSWITIPVILMLGLSEYGKVYNTQYLFNQFFTNNYYSGRQILLNNYDILKRYLDNDVFLNDVQSYQYYNNSLPDGVCAYNFCLFSEDLQPSGTANFSVFKAEIINFILNKDFIQEYFKFDPNNYGLLLKFMTRSHNFLVVEKGIATIIFATN
jgi:hypothetical protein